MILCKKELREAWELRRLIVYNANQRSTVRFVRTNLGSVWLGLSASLSTAVLAFVYSTIFKVSDFNNYIISLGLGLSLYNGIASAIGSAPSILDKSVNHINNINTPHVFYFFEEWVFNLQTFAQSFSLVFVFLCFFKFSMVFHIIWPLIPTLINFAIAMFWLPSLICFVGIWIKDLYQLIPVILQLLFLLTPILFDKSALGSASFIADLNIIFRYMSPVRQALMNGYFDFGDALFLFVLNIVGVFVVLNFIRINKNNIPFLI